MDLNFAGEGFSTRLKTRLDTGHEIALRSYTQNTKHKTYRTTKMHVSDYLFPPTQNKGLEFLVLQLYRNLHRINQYN